MVELSSRKSSGSVAGETSLRHADIHTTLDTYTQAMREDLRAANSRVVRMVMGGSEGQLTLADPGKSAKPLFLK